MPPRIMSVVIVLGLLTGCSAPSGNNANDRCRSLATLSFLGAMLGSSSYTLAGSVGDGLSSASSTSGTCE
jgi:hypothetical protein